jgi:hypothetical protein
MTDIWKASDEKLYKASLTAIRRFAREHREMEVCCLFLDSDDPCYGHISISLDTLENNIRSTKKRERSAIDHRRKYLYKPEAWRNAKYQIEIPVLSPFNLDGGDFAFQEYISVDFPSWVRLAKKNDYPRGREHEDDYLEANVRLVMWRVIERLVKTQAFDFLTLASPFMTGYSLHDEGGVLVRLLNWPASASGSSQRLAR